MATWSFGGNEPSNITQIDCLNIDPFNLTEEIAPCDPWDQRIRTASIYAIIGGIGIIINSLPIIITAASKLKQNNVNILVAHLSVADLVVCLIFACGQNVYVLYKEKIGPLGCQWFGFVNTCCGFQVFIFPAVLSLNRYVSLYHSEHYDRIYTKKNVWLMILASWAFVSSIILIFSSTGHTGWDEDNQHCCVIMRNSIFWTVLFWIICMGPIVGLGDITVLFCNWKIYKKLTDHAASAQMTKSVISQHRELLYFLIIEMIVPMLFHSTYLLAKFAYPQRLSLFGKQFFSIIYLINSTTRSLVMMTMLRPLRNEFLRIFCNKNIDERKTIGGKSVTKVEVIKKADIEVKKVEPANMH